VTQWKVTYTLVEGVEVESSVKDYPAFGLELYYDGDKLVKVDHTIEAEDTASHDGLIVLSERKLQLFWELLHYRRGLPIRIASRTTEKAKQDPTKPTVRTGQVTLPMSVCLVCTIKMPTENSLTSAPLRLSTWLRFANEARNAHSDVGAVLAYYLIWEDMKGRPQKGSAGPSELELKYTRDFVSHGEVLKNKNVLAFLRAKLKGPVNQFDPNDRDHQALVRDQRKEARKLVETELDKLL